MSAAPMGRNKGGNRVTKLDRDTSKKNVALSKAKQRDALAAKNFVKHQKQVKKDLEQLIKLRRSIEEMLKKLKEDRQLDQRFLNQVTKKVRSLKDFSTFIKASEREHSVGVQQPKMYTAIVRDAGKVPKINTVNTMGDLTIILAMTIVILKRILALKPAK
ncbi:hypothetical protein [Ruegeria conchae]|uniref:hypothetical protein n=1 Tax=Ruegeria conchae TaxID=981384 RepID=UPI0029C918EA|nr:hypothetical protein [Ruegeria conchae]